MINDRDGAFPISLSFSTNYCSLALRTSKAKIDFLHIQEISLTTECVS